MLKKLISGLVLVSLTTFLFAGEGMWIPIFLKQLNEAEMKAHGMQLSAEDIYSINQSSLKDAIVHFGGGCTSEIISSDGLLLTNHHCGYGQVQAHSSVEHDYLTDGYWAMNRGEELPNPGLTATLIKRIEPVTEQVMAGVTDDMSEQERQKKIEANSREAESAATKGSHYGAMVKSFYEGNEYYLFITETFKDIRLVGAPPSSIGKFGFDTDNWIWPRHTGDFSLFRIYAGKDNKPAAYSEDNVPYTPAHYLPITLNGVKEGDFTMVYGFPGRTEEYLTSHAVELIQERSDPLKIAIRTKKLEILDRAMAASDEVRIKYAAKQSRTSNSWKKWKGEIRGLKKLDAIEKKKSLEADFGKLVKANPDYKPYEGLVERLGEHYRSLEEVQVARDYFVEVAYWGIDLLHYASGFMKEVKKAQKGETMDTAAVERFRKMTAGHFKDYDMETDREIFRALLEMYGQSPENQYKPKVFEEIDKKYKGDYSAYTTALYERSILVSEEKMNKLLADWDEKAAKQLAKDPLYQLTAKLYDNYQENIRPAYDAIQSRISPLQREYMKAQMVVLADHRQYYPDANSTLRITYGKVSPYEPVDAVKYEYYTTLDGVIEKYDPAVKEFDLPQKLIQLYEDKDYGPYGENGMQPVCFIASNHTTGGNSGSPVLNAKGELVGLNFDRNWEGTMSDIMYDPSQCRNIAVDIRYVLFIIDKFAGAGYLLETMNIKN